MANDYTQYGSFELKDGFFFLPSFGIELLDKSQETIDKIKALGVDIWDGEITDEKIDFEKFKKYFTVQLLARSRDKARGQKELFINTKFQKCTVKDFEEN